MPTPLTAIAASASHFARQGCAALARIGEDFGFVGDATSVTVCVSADTCAEAVCGLVGAEEKDLGCGAHVENGSEYQKTRLKMRVSGVLASTLAAGGLGND